MWLLMKLPSLRWNNVFFNSAEMFGCLNSHKGKADNPTATTVKKVNVRFCRDLCFCYTYKRDRLVSFSNGSLHSKAAVPDVSVGRDSLVGKRELKLRRLFQKK